MNKKLYVKKEYIPFLLLFVVQCLYHIVLRENASSDAVKFFGQQLYQMSLSEYLVMRYQTWTSRLFVEALEVLISNHLTLWKILDVIVWMLTAYFLVVIFNNGEDEKSRTRLNWIIIGFVLIFPFGILSSAGWISTTLNYTWVLMPGLFLYAMIAKIFRDQKVGVLSLILSIPAVLYAANEEQMCVVLLFSLPVLIFALQFFEKKSFRQVWMIYLWEILVVAELAFVATCPGNSARREAEQAQYFQNFASLNLFDKLALGLSDTMYRLMNEGCYIYLIFTILLAYLVLKKSKEIWIRAVAFFPLLWEILFTFLKSYFADKNGDLWSKFSNGVLVDGTNYHHAYSYLPIAVYLAILFCVVVSLLYISESWTEAFLQVICFVVGFGSRWMMGFTPTITPSAMRTFTFFYGALIVGILLMEHYHREEFVGDGRAKRAIELGFTLMVVMSVIQGVLAAGTF